MTDDKIHHHAGDKGVEIPKKGDRFKCNTCPMQIEVTAECKCTDPGDVHFHCCGHEMLKV